MSNTKTAVQRAVELSCEKYNKQQEYKQAVIDYLNNYRYNEETGEPATHQSYGQFIQGRFSIPPNCCKEFMNLYSSAISYGFSYFSILEVQKEYSPIIVDIDLKTPNNVVDDYTRSYDENLIQNIMQKYITAINTYLNVNEEDFKVSLFEKEYASFTPEIKKDGFHLVFHNICANTKIRHMIRDKVVKMCEQDKTFKGFDDEPKTIIDKAVVSSNGWFLYGSRKPGHEPYKLTKIYDIDLNLLYDHEEGVEYCDNKRIKSQLDNGDLAKMFSIHYRRKKYSRKSQTPIKEDVIIEEEQEKEKPKQINTTNEPTKDIRALKCFAKCINDFSRFGNFEGWFKLCASLKTANDEYDDEDLFEIFDNISSKSANYKGTKDCRKTWNSLKEDKNKMSLGSFFKWCEEDDIEKYEKYCLKFKMLRYKEIIDRMDKDKQANKLKHKEAKQQVKLSEEELKKQKDKEAYEKTKKQFEETHFKIKNPAVFACMYDGKLILKTKQELITTYENTYYGEGENEKPFIPKWIKDKDNRTYQELDFRPKQQVPAHIYNTFSGYEIEKKTSEPNNIDIKTTKLWEHIFNICGREQQVMDYVLKCLANIIQHPNISSRVCLLFKSKEGSGKDTFFNWFGNKIIGQQYYLNDSNIDLMFGKFNPSLNNKVLVVINETEHNDTMKTMAKIKDAITKPTNKIEAKHKDVIEQQNNVFYVMLSNNNNPIPVSASDRRICAIECNNTICNNEQYFNALHNELYSETIDKVFYDYLNNLDITNYNFVGNRPMTNYYKDLKLRNKPIIAQFLCDIVDNYPNQTDLKFTCIEFYEEFKIFLNTNGYPSSYSNTKFGLDLKEFSEFKGVEKQKSNGKFYYKINKKCLKQHLLSVGWYEEVPEVNFIDV